ncbi:hypothetical protein HZY97_09020 [Sphingomonas sp. R-74633]|uniref:hypothetical protein n=1 Tax=Sphingomonas sp. R-74633 TaxID=2751188 RepID=UPI0015D2092C|nr:hypothetical protein [Sphingomonas sp. R-74633]NYT40894.1 hypothetical protein [Sphingomonas sp. R-74633]
MRAIREQLWVAYLLLLIWVIIPVLRGEFDIRTLIGLGAMALAGFAAWFLAKRVARPLRSYLFVLLGSACVAALFAQFATILAWILWLALSVFALIWAWYWERTEPRLPA